MSADARPAPERDRVALHAGIAAGFDPRPPEEPAEGETVTRAESWWTYELCEGCGHTFRRGDRVRVIPATGGRPARVRHVDPPLDPEDAGTAGDAGGVPPVPGGGERESVQFAEGLRAAWPALGGGRELRLDASSPLVARPEMGRLAPRCRYCAHTFRAGEVVVVCPCGMFDDEYACAAAVHRDPVAGLACWDDWCPDGRLSHCPVSHQELVYDPVTGRPDMRAPGDRR